jgi:hypothetical protein
MNATKQVEGNSLHEGKTRVQLDLSPSMMERLNWSMDVCELETRKDLFNSALSLFEWAVKEAIEGRSVASVDRERKHYTELTMPALVCARRHGERLREEARAVA